MKIFKYLIFSVAILTVASCGQAPQHSATVAEKQELPEGTYGHEVGTENAFPAADVMNLFGNSDTAEITVSGPIAASCKHSGCWMDIDMGNGETLHVTFKDESFTIPLDAAGKNAIAQGIAVRELIPVETLQNYAREDGKSEEEVAAITQPAYEYQFVATGVLIGE
jgi:hypothetical protein